MAETSSGDPTGSQRKELNQRFTEAYFGATIRVPTAFTTSEIRRSFNRLSGAALQAAFFCRFCPQRVGGDGMAERTASDIGGVNLAGATDKNTLPGLADNNSLNRLADTDGDTVTKAANANTGLSGLAHYTLPVNVENLALPQAGNLAGTGNDTYINDAVLAGTPAWTHDAMFTGAASHPALCEQAGSEMAEFGIDLVGATPLAASDLFFG